jgi:curli biogenesis system outer membrane secretion channel CsgG
MRYRDLNVTVMRVLSDYVSGAGYPDLDKYKENENANGKEKEKGNGKENGNGVTPPVTGYVTGYDTQGKSKSVEKRSGNPFMSFAKGGL